ncbi:hypothetical protein CCACVL1_14994 [Corchorus capsularis]|uniref:Uncharacterized protein n=1 Tax=Corchorus capsularis TaxID=210143 RepID=A0A1R3I4I6_COCAP|nr:hypothetical protein CCACVL1_14994 [Corchorus capsularis]
MGHDQQLTNGEYIWKLLCCCNA